LINTVESNLGNGTICDRCKVALSSIIGTQYVRIVQLDGPVFRDTKVRFFYHIYVTNAREGLHSLKEREDSPILSSATS